MNLLATTKTQDQVESGLLLDDAVTLFIIFFTIPGEVQPLLIRGNPLLVLNLGLDILNDVRGLNLKGDGLYRKGLHEDLHDSEKFNIRFVKDKEDYIIMKLKWIN